MKSLLPRVKDLFPYTRDLRREFHQHPELGFQEYKTSKIILRELSSLDDFVITNRVAETGIVGFLPGAKPGKTILLRFDMDALPVQEETGVAYTSIHDGLMHGCGHDGHMAIGLCVARLIMEIKEDLCGQVMLLFQPAEEGLGGAQRVIDEGGLGDPGPDLCLALHLWNEKPLGWVGISDGPVMAASETFRITIEGRGGHGGMPEEAVDPILAASAVIQALQTLVSREIHPQEGAVVSVCTIRAGEAPNVIPDKAVLTGTLRSFSPDTRQYLIDRFTDLVKSVAASYRCQAQIVIDDISPPVINDPEVAGIVREVARETFPELEIDQGYQTTASEDMSLIMERVPGCYFFVGSSNQSKGLTAKHHQPDFNFDEEALIYAAALLVNSVQKILS